MVFLHETVHTRHLQVVTDTLHNSKEVETQEGTETKTAQSVLRAASRII